MSTYRVINEFKDRQTGERLRPGATIATDDTRRAAELVRRNLVHPDPVPEPPARAKPPSGDLAKLTVPQLQELAADRGVELSSGMRKADIIAALEAAEEDGDGANDGVGSGNGDAPGHAPSDRRDDPSPGDQGGHADADPAGAASQTAEGADAQPAAPRAPEDGGAGDNPSGGSGTGDGAAIGDEQER